MSNKTSESIDSDKDLARITKLSGSNNYVIWAKEIRLFLRSRGLEDHINGVEVPCRKPRNFDVAKRSIVVEIPKLTADVVAAPTLLGTPASLKQKNYNDIDSFFPDFNIEYLELTASEIKALEDYEKWSTNNARAIQCILYTTQQTIRQRWGDAQLAKQLWSALETTYTNKGFSRKREVIANITRLTYEGCKDAKDFNNRFMKCVSDVQQAGVIWNESTYVALFLIATMKSFEQWTARVEQDYNDLNPPTLDDLTSGLTEAYTHSICNSI